MTSPRRQRRQIILMISLASYFLFTNIFPSTNPELLDSTKSTGGFNSTGTIIRRHNHTGTNYREGLDFAAAGCVDFECSSDVERCDNNDATNYSQPCCTHILRDMTRAFDEEMSKMGIEYFVGFGTMLGFRRSDKIIPWTSDIDFVMHDDQFAVMKKSWDGVDVGLNFVTKPAGIGYPARLCITSNFAGGRIRGKNATMAADPWADPIWDRGIPYGDIYHMKTLSSDTVGNEYPRCVHRQGTVYPIQRRWVYDRSFELSFPRKPELMLAAYYGLNWMKPPPKKKGNGELPNTYCRVNYGLHEELD